ncbi:MAG: hypothetical protein HOV94_06230 [Saccharothrix sp.]|nr:hypothetical protein [Saccharothrix sp.]
MGDRVDLPEWLVFVLELIELLALVGVFLALPVVAIVSQVVIACAR